MTRDNKSNVSGYTARNTVVGRILARAKNEKEREGPVSVNGVGEKRTGGSEDRHKSIDQGNFEGGIRAGVISLTKRSLAGYYGKMIASFTIIPCLRGFLARGNRAPLVQKKSNPGQSEELGSSAPSGADSRKHSKNIQHRGKNKKGEHLK